MSPKRKNENRRLQDKLDVQRILRRNRNPSRPKLQNHFESVQTIKIEYIIIESVQTIKIEYIIIETIITELFDCLVVRQKLIN
jgi:hypothetical protein